MATEDKEKILPPFAKATDGKCLNMIHFTKYAEHKFDVLNKYQVYFTREQIEEVVMLPDKVSKKGNYQSARKENIKVVFKKESGIIRIITFYPVK